MTGPNAFPYKPEHWMEQAACRGHDPRLWECATCPIVETCRELRDGAEGTWGGKLYRSKRTQTLANPKPRRSRAEREANGAAARERRAREEAAYSDEEARRAHAAYIAEASPSEWARTGHRVYTRRQAQKARGVAA